MLNKLLYASQNTEHQLRTIEDQIQTDENQLRTDGNQPRTDQNQLQAGEEDTQRLHYASYPNINGLTSKLKNIFRNDNVKIAVRNLKTVGSLYTRLKDPIPTLQKSNVVYAIDCQDCDKKYIGQTSQWWKNRLTQEDIMKDVHWPPMHSI